MMFSATCLALVSCLLQLSSALPGTATAPTAKVKNGTVEGYHLASYDQDLFLGIPFAQPPVGELRFKVPQPLNTTYSGTYQAKTFYPECVGYGGDDIGYEVSEDCLALNVVRPSGYAGQKLPVAVWIHGGGLQMGGTPDRRYNLSFIVQNSVEIGKPIIGVAIAYRLASWGFLASQEIVGSGNTNLGLRDQRLALHWLQENIAAFGGNKSMVTIWGESAGAYSVGAHLVAYGGRDDKLFRAGIMESGNPVNYVPYQDAGFYQPSYSSIVNQTGCNTKIDTLDCLRKVPYAKLNAVLNQTAFTTVRPFNPIIDGDLIQGFTSLQLASGDFVHVPLISGANSDEGTAFTPQGINTTAEFRAYLTGGANPATIAALPDFFASEILTAYPDVPSEGIPGAAELGSARLPDYPYGAQYRRTAAYAGDEVFIANRRLTCQAWAKAKVAAYCYRFNAIPTGLTPAIGVTHFQEVAFVFDNVQGLGYAVDPFANKTASFVALSKLMSCSWASFVHDLDPNSFRASAAGAKIAGAAAEWPKYGTGAAAQNIVWDANVTSHAEPDTFRSAGIDLINRGNLLFLR